MWVNVILAMLKFAGGVLGHSTAMIADAGHTLSDLLSDFITLWAVQIARLPPDDDHPYGHGRFEAVGSLFLSLMLIGTGFTVGGFSYEQLSQAIATSANGGNFPVTLPSWPALVTAFASIIGKEALYRVTVKVGKALDSQVLIANAWHHRSDAFSSVISLFAIAGAMAGFGFLDGVAGIFVAGMISLTGLEVMKDSIRQLTDTTDQNLLKRVENIVRGVQGVHDVVSVRARSVGARHLVDMTVHTDSKISATAAHQVAERVRWTVLEQLSEVAEVLVHMRALETRCPLVVGLRAQAEIEKDVRSIMDTCPHVTGVSKVTVHYLDMQPHVEVAIQVDPKVRLRVVPC
jgi:cation diffusion facilitator family transporter